MSLLPHAGDNAVLMQKVAKERLGAFKPSRLKSQVKPDLESLEFLHSVMVMRENHLFGELGHKLVKVGLGF